MTALKENIEKAFQLRPKANFIDLMMKVCILTLNIVINFVIIV